MQNDDCIELKHTFNVGCGVTLLVIALAALLLQLIFMKEAGPTGFVVAGVLIPFGVLALVSHMRTLFDTRRRKIIKRQGGIFHHETEYDLDDCSIHVKSGYDSGIWHSVSIVSGEKQTEVTGARSFISIGESYFETRRLAKKWAQLMGLKIYEATFGIPVERKPEDIGVPLIHSYADFVPAPGPNPSFQITKENGKLVIEMPRTREKVVVLSNALSFESKLLWFRLDSYSNFQDIMEIEVNYADGQGGVTILEPRKITTIGRGYPREDLEWLRGALHYVLSGLPQSRASRKAA